MSTAFVGGSAKSVFAAHRETPWLPSHEHSEVKVTLGFWRPSMNDAGNKRIAAKPNIAIETTQRAIMRGDLVQAFCNFEKR